MTEFDINEALFNREFLQGFLNEHAIKGYKMLPMIPKMELKADTFSYFEDESLEEAIEAEKQHKARRMPEGAMLEEIAVTGFNEKHGTIFKRGYKITVGENLLDREPTKVRSLLNKMSRLSVGLARQAEFDVYDNLIAKAMSDGLYNEGTIPDMIGANANLPQSIIDTQIEYDLDNFEQELDFLMVNKSDLGAIRGQLNDNEIVTQNRLVEGWKNGAAFDYAGMTFMKGCKKQVANSILGWDRSQDFGYVFYTKEKKGYNPKIQTGLEAFSPLMNVTVQEPNDYDMPREYTIRMMMGTGLAVESPHLLWYRDDIGGGA